MFCAVRPLMIAALLPEHKIAVFLRCIINQNRLLLEIPKQNFDACRRKFDLTEY